MPRKTRGSANRSTALCRLFAVDRGVFRGRTVLFACGVYDVLRADADAVFHVEHRAIDGNPIEEGGGEMGIVEEGSPLVKS